MGPLAIPDRRPSNMNLICLGRFEPHEVLRALLPNSRIQLLREVIQADSQSVQRGDSVAGSRGSERLFRRDGVGVEARTSAGIELRELQRKTAIRLRKLPV